MIKQKISGPRPLSHTESIVWGCHWIMKKYGGYTHFDFFHGRNGVPMYASTFFELIDNIKREVKLEEKEIKNAEKNANKGSGGGKFG